MIEVFVFRILNVDNDKPDDDGEGNPKNSNDDEDEQLPINNVNNPEEGSIWVNPRRPIHFLERIFFSIFFLFKISVWSRKHF